MKYRDKYPDIKPIHDQRDSIILGSKESSCTFCKELTPFVDIHYEASFCSEECLKNWETEFFSKYK